MLDKIFQQNLRELFNSGKFEDVIKKVEDNYSRTDRPPGLSSLIGICRVLSPNSTKEDLILALSDFEDSYNKFGRSDGAIEAICNYITTIVKNSKKYTELLAYLTDAKNMYLNAEMSYGYNEKLFIHGADLFTLLLDHKKTLKILNNLIENNSSSKIVACQFGHLNNYLYDWKQIDYFNFSKKFKSFFTKLNTRKLNEIDYSQNKKIKIAFVSCDFTKDHSVTHFAKNTIKYLDDKIFEKYGVSFSSDRFLKDTSLELKKYCNKWLNLSKLNNQEVIDLIQNEKIEILIDIMGLTQANRIEIFNSRVSPLQISWMAFCNTVGFDTIDYLISDKNLIYQSEEKLYSESIIKMPNIWNCHSGLNFDRKFNKLPFLKNNYLTFGSFNNFLKINDNVIRVWGEILKRVKNSKLILKSSFNYNSSIIIDKFKKLGVNNSIEFFDQNNFPNIQDHIELYDKLDLALDTFPYNGVTTTFESLWAGVPVICMKGHNFNSRCGESIMINGKLEQFLAANEEDYIKKVIYYANNIEELSKERENIFHNILETPLFKSKEYASNLKSEILKIYNRKLN